jgi:hypothetical protein
MKIFTRIFPQSARLLTITALAGLCHTGLNTQAATLPPANSAPASPANMAATPASSQPTVDQDIRDIRPPYHIPPGWLWLAWVGGGLALVALGYGAWRWRHRLGLRVKLPYEIALEQLEAARHLMQPEQARAFSIAVSEIVRDYIETGFDVRAAHRTTEEFLRDLATQSDSPLVAHQPVLADFLRHCDLAKFARWVLSLPQMEAMLQSAAAFIVATGKPVACNSPARSAGTSSPHTSPGVLTVAPVSCSSKTDALSSASTTLNPQSLGLALKKGVCFECQLLSGKTQFLSYAFLPPVPSRKSRIDWLAYL